VATRDRQRENRSNLTLEWVKCHVYDLDYNVSDFRGGESIRAIGPTPSELDEDLHERPKTLIKDTADRLDTGLHYSDG
jgi:hypothetical protein